MRLEGVGQGSNPWGGVPEGVVIVLMLVLFAQSVVVIARVRKERMPMDEKSHQLRLFGLTLLEHTLIAFANITCGMLLPSI